MSLGVAQAQKPLLTSRSFDRWVSELKERCTTVQEAHEVWIEDLQPTQSLIVIYPKHFSAWILNWVSQGGHLMLMLNARSTLAAQALLKSLDLTPLPLNDDQRGLRGAWPYPQSKLGSAQNVSLFISPWVTLDGIAFKEGASWFKGGIAPIAIDEQGRSMGYRVRYGKGSLMLFGDADALTDEFLKSPLNRRFSQSLAWRITKRDRKQMQRCDLTWMPPQGSLRSKQEEESLKSRVNKMWAELISWWHKVNSPQDKVSPLLKLISFALALLFLGLINMLTSHRDWKRRFIKKRR